MLRNKVSDGLMEHILLILVQIDSKLLERYDRRIFVMQKQPEESESQEEVAVP